MLRAGGSPCSRATSIRTPSTYLEMALPSNPALGPPAIRGRSGKDPGAHPKLQCRATNQARTLEKVNRQARPLPTRRLRSRNGPVPHGPSSSLLRRNVSQEPTANPKQAPPHKPEHRKARCSPPVEASGPGPARVRNTVAAKQSQKAEAARSIKPSAVAPMDKKDLVWNKKPQTHSASLSSNRNQHNGGGFPGKPPPRMCKILTAMVMTRCPN